MIAPTRITLCITAFKSFLRRALFMRLILASAWLILHAAFILRHSWWQRIQAA